MRSRTRSYFDVACAGVVVAAAVSLLCLSWLTADPLRAQVSEITPSNTAFAFETITVSTTAIGFTSTVISPAGAIGGKSAFCTVESQPIRWREDGTVPTASVGHPKVAGTEVSLIGLNNMLKFKAIRSGATDATLSCTYFR